MGAKESIQLVAECSKAGEILFPDAVKATGTFHTLGNLIVLFLGVANPNPDIGRELQELKGSINRLHNDMRRGFRGVEALIVEHSFTKDIIHKVENQERFLENLLAARSKEAMEQFLHECDRHRPQTLLSEIIGFIKHDVTNPIKYTMNANVLKSREIAGKWRRKIQNLAGTLAMIHGVFYGIKRWKNDGTMATNIKELEKALNEFERNFKLDYWPALWEFASNTQDTRTDIGNGPKADIIRNGINNMFTNDQFYIIVYNDCAGYEKHSFRHHGDHTFARFGRGGCNIIIYQSKTAHSVSDAAYQAFGKRLNNWKYDHIENRGDLKKVTNMIWDDMSANFDTGFVGIIRAQHQPAIRATDGRRSMPGAWIEARCFVEKKWCLDGSSSVYCVNKWPVSHAYLMAGFT